MDAGQSPPVIPPFDLLPFEKSKPLVVKMSRGESASLRFGAHPRFGIGVVLGTREADSGSVTDLWFLDGRVRAILPAHLQDAIAELTKDQRKELRHAASLYRKAHVKKPNVRIELAFTKLTNGRNATAHVAWENFESAPQAAEEDPQDFETVEPGNQTPTEKDEEQ